MWGQSIGPCYEGDTHSRGRPAQCPHCRQPLCLLSFLLRSPGCRDLLLPGAVTPSQDTSRLNKENYFINEHQVNSQLYLLAVLCCMNCFTSLAVNVTPGDKLSVTVIFESIAEKMATTFLGQGNCETVTHICIAALIG